MRAASIPFSFSFSTLVLLLLAIPRVVVHLTEGNEEEEVGQESPSPPAGSHVPWLTLENFDVFEELEPAERARSASGLFDYVLRLDADVRLLAEVLRRYRHILTSPLEHYVSEAILYDRLDVVRLLAAHGADLHTMSPQPLDFAILHGRVEIVEWLIDSAGVGTGGNDSTEREDGKWRDERPSPLHIAARQGNRRMVEMLLAKGVWKVSERTVTGNTPLYGLAVSRAEDREHFAAYQARMMETVRGEEGVRKSPLPPNVLDLYDEKGTAEALLAAGADWSGTQGGKPTTIYVLDQCCDVFPGSAGLDMLTIALTMRNFGVVEALLAHGGDPIWPPPTATTPEGKRLSEMALAAGAPPGVQGVLGWLKARREHEKLAPFFDAAMRGIYEDGGVGARDEL